MMILRLQLLILLVITPLCGESLITEHVKREAGKKYGPQAQNRFKDMESSLFKKLHNESDIKKLNFVNTWVNGIAYRSDKSIYGVNDYWATLYEFVGKNRGDCEDYTITKYYILKELGINPKRMKFTYVIYKDRHGRKISHMVLSYLKVLKPKSRNDILILDNTNRFVLPASKRSDIIKVVKMINGDTGPKSKKWKKLEANMKRKKL
jgi:predicted transglutaminase-like cysteine proteinase